jgi:hypothetical protein
VECKQYLSLRQLPSGLVKCSCGSVKQEYVPTALLLKRLAGHPRSSVSSYRVQLMEYERVRSRLARSRRTARNTLLVGAASLSGLLALVLSAYL